MVASITHLYSCGMAEAFLLACFALSSVIEVQSIIYASCGALATEHGITLREARCPSPPYRGREQTHPLLTGRGEAPPPPRKGARRNSPPPPPQADVFLFER